MEPKYWERRWADGETGFHRLTVNPYLERNLGHTGVHGGRVLVPLCGKSMDLDYFASLGFEVLGVELSEIAVRQFFDERGLSPTVRRVGAFEVYAHGPVSIACGDFFSLPEGDLVGILAFDRVTLVYDRAALIALPSELRTRYVETLRRVLPSSAVYLLLSLAFDETERGGPPFSVTRDEVTKQYGGWREVRCVETVDITSESPKLVERGATVVREDVYVMRPLPAVPSELTPGAPTPALGPAKRTSPRRIVTPVASSHSSRGIACFRETLACVFSQRTSSA